MEDVKKDHHHHSERSSYYSENDNDENHNLTDVVELPAFRNGIINKKIPHGNENNINRNNDNNNNDNNSMTIPTSSTRQTSHSTIPKISSTGHYHTNNTKPQLQNGTTTTPSSFIKVSISSLDCPSYLLYSQSQVPKPTSSSSLVAQSSEHSERPVPVVSTTIAPRSNGILAPPSSSSSSQRTRKIQPSTFLNSFRTNGDTTTTVTMNHIQPLPNQYTSNCNSMNDLEPQEGTDNTHQITATTKSTRTGGIPSLPTPTQQPTSTIRSESRLRKRQSRTSSTTTTTTTTTTNPKQPDHTTDAAVLDPMNANPQPQRTTATSSHQQQPQRPRLKTSSSTSQRRKSHMKSKASNSLPSDDTTTSITVVPNKDAAALLHHEPPPPLPTGDPSTKNTTSRTKVVKQTRLQRRSSLRHNNKDKTNATGSKAIDSVVAQEPVTEGVVVVPFHVSNTNNNNDNNKQNHDAHNNESTTSFDLNDLLLLASTTETESNDLNEPKVSLSSSVSTMKRKSVRTTTIRNNNHGVVGIGTTRQTYKSPLKQRISSSTSTTTATHHNNNNIHKSPRTTSTNSKSRTIKDLSASTSAMTTSISLMQKLHDLQQPPLLHTDTTGLVDLNRSIRW